MEDKAKWWKNAVGYQIYPKSFQDTNGDGIGDIQGIIERLPYLKDLGVDFVWINPIYKSPNVDNGYDISDFRDVNPEYGTMDDVKELLEVAHQLGIKVLMDLVVNHTSDQHPWFIESKKSKDNPYRDYYHWVDCTPENLPNNWISFFGGSVWEYDETTEQAYFHIFYKEQPDLNWKNEKMRQEIYAMIRFWLDLGIDGFRLDAISHIQKEDWSFKIKSLKDNDPWQPFMNVEGIEDYMSEIKAIFDEYNIMTVGEASGVNGEKALRWTSEGGYINMIFELEHNHRKGELGEQMLDIPRFKAVYSKWQRDLANGGWNAPYIENHDNPRINSILGNETEKSAKACGMFYFFLSGTPFIYQGQELGMTNFPFTTIQQVDDGSDKMKYNQYLDGGETEEKALKMATRWSRDHSRTPMQWNAEMNAGFTVGQPWMPVNPNYLAINVSDEEENEESVLNFYKEMIRIRKNNPLYSEGDYEELIPEVEEVACYLRRLGEHTALVVVNLSDEEVKIAIPKPLLEGEWKCLLTNTEETSVAENIKLKGFDAFLFEK